MYDTVEEDVPQLDQVLSILPVLELLPPQLVMLEKSTGSNLNAGKMD